VSLLLVIVAIVAQSGAAPNPTAPPKAWIVCETDPPGAQVLMGHPMSRESWEKGTTPARVPIYELSPMGRELRVTLRKTGFEPYSATVSIKPDDTIRISATLVPRQVMAYVSDGKLVLANADGSDPADLAPLAVPVSWEAPVWLPGGDVCVWQAGELARIDSTGKTVCAVASSSSRSVVGPGPKAEKAHRAVALRSGAWVAYLDRTAAGKTGALLAATGGGAEPVLLALEASRLAACPSEDVLAVTDPTGTKIIGIGADGRVDPIKDLPGVRELAWSPDGARVAALLDGEVYCGDAGLGDLTRLTSSDGAGPEDLVWTPDGAALVCTIHREQTRRTRWDEIWLIHAPGEIGEPMLLVDGHDHPYSGSLAPLGFVPGTTRLAYRVGEPPSCRTYVTDAAGPGGPEPLLLNSGLPAWSAPGTPVGAGSSESPSGKVDAR